MARLLYPDIGECRALVIDGNMTSRSILAGMLRAMGVGHVAYAVPDIYATCQRLVDHGVAILRPPRDGRMAFVRSPDHISIELLQAGPALPAAEPWSSMPNTGSW